MPVRANIGLGSNVGDRLEMLQRAVDLLARSPGIRVTRSSRVYETDPVGGPPQPDFLNAVIEVETDLPAPDLLLACLAVEERLKRAQSVRWGPRSIDLDVLTYGNEHVSLDSPDLEIPHPRMHERAFVVAPLLELDPDPALPGGRRVGSLRLGAGTLGGVRPYAPPLTVPGRNLEELPPDLSVPEDDGATDHLPGTPAPEVPLSATSGRTVVLTKEPGNVVVYCYPRTGRPGQPSPPGWDAIPGARGCTPESCGFRDHHEELRVLGAAVFGLSTQTSEYQREMVARLGLPFEVLSDADLAFVQALRLPTFEVEGEALVKRLTLVIRDGVIEHVFYPVFPPDRHAEEVAAWLVARAGA